MDAQTAAAARLLFGFEPPWDRLHLAAVREAFRKKAMQLHPDRFASDPPQVQRTRTERFQKVSAAYELLLEVLSGRAAGPTHRRSPAPSAAAQDSTQRTASPRRPSSGAEGPRSSVSSRPASPPAHVERAATPGRVPPPRPPLAAPAADDTPLPGIPFRLGTFLRRRGAVSAFELAAALAEQSRSRTRLGDVAVHWKWLEREQADAIARQARPLERFGETAQRLGFTLSRDQVSRLLWYQRTQQRRLGEALVEKGALTRQRLEELMVELARHNAQVRLRGGWEARLGPEAERMNQPL